MQASVNLRSLSFGDYRTYTLALLFIAGNVLFPQLCHLIPQGGLTWLPIYFFTLVAAYTFGWRAGLITAIASPLVNSALFGMPAAEMLPVILLKSILLASIAAYVAHRTKAVSLIAIAAVVLGYQIIGTAGEWAICGSLAAACSDLHVGLPGILLQIAGGWALIRYLAGR